MSSQDVKILRQELKELRELVISNHKEMEPMREWFQNINWGKGMVIGTLKFLGIVSGLVLSIAAILKLFR